MKKKPTKLTFDIHLTEHAQMSLSIAMTESELAAGTVVENALDLYVEMVRQQQKICQDCELFCGRERYWVLDRVWEEAGKVPGDLCIGCLEIRLGRSLLHRDFDTDDPRNFSREVTDNTRRLMKRMAGLHPSEALHARLEAAGAVLLEVSTTGGGETPWARS